MVRHLIRFSVAFLLGWPLIASAQLVFCINNTSGALFARPACGPGFTQLDLQSIPGLQGPEGPAGPPGPAGPAGPPVTASFELLPSLKLVESGEEFTNILSKEVSTGSWLIFSTVSIELSGGPFTGDDERAFVADCRLRDNQGNFMGGNRATGTVTQFTEDAWEITVNGGIFVPEGEPTRIVNLECRTIFENGEVTAAQLLVVKIGGFQ